MERTFDAEWVNSIVNHPDVYPFVRGDLEGPLDMGPALSDPRHIMLQAPDKTGGWLFQYLSPGIYECHSAFLPEGRGSHVAQLAHDSLKWFFENTDASIILARCPVDNKPVIKLTKAAGFKYVGQWGDWIINGVPVPTDRYQLTRENWEKAQAKQKK
jgi:RimJ/RimL family protein N-acetyltransferase